MTQPPPLRVALVGFGRLAERHYVPALQRLRDIAVVTCVVERLPHRRDVARTGFPAAQFYPDLVSLLGIEKVDAILVATPPSAHRDAIKLALHHQLPLFLEKPFLAPGELPGFSRLPAPSAPMMIDFNRRFWPPYVDLRNRLGTRRTTQPARVRIILHVDAQAWNSVTDYRMHREEGGVLQDLGSHAIDLATFLVAQSVARVRARFHDGTGDKAAVTIKMDFCDGSSSICSIAYSPRPIERITALTGNNSYTIIHPMAGLRANVENFFSPIGLAVDFAAVANHVVRRQFSMIGATIFCALHQFFSSVRIGEKPKPGWNDALENARVLETIWRSYRDNRTVNLNDTSIDSL